MAPDDGGADDDQHQGDDELLHKAISFAESFSLRPRRRRPRQPPRRAEQTLAMGRQTRQRQKSSVCSKWFSPQRTIQLPFPLLPSSAFILHPSAFDTPLPFLRVLAAPPPSDPSPNPTPVSV